MPVCHSRGTANIVHVMLQRSVNHDSSTTSRTLRYSWLSLALPKQSCLTAVATSDLAGCDGIGGPSVLFLFILFMILFVLFLFFCQSSQRFITVFLS